MITTLIYFYVLSWWFVNFEPIQNTLDTFFKDKDDTISDSIYTALGCQKCFTFWIVLCFTWNPLYAMSLSMIASIHSDIINRIRR